MRPFAIFILLAFVGQASAGPNAKTGGSASTAVISSTRFPGDFDWDFDVDFADFLAFVSVFGKTSADADYNPRMDMDGSGAINFADFVAFAGVFGRTYTRPPWAEDRDALIALYHATGGDSWTDRTNWLTNADLSTWHGVTVSNGRVTRLGLGGNNLSGSIPSELGNLFSLQELRLNDNTSLTGTLPQSLTGLTKLSHFQFHNTGLCAPLDGAFQTWLQGIEDTGGSNCSGGGTLSPDRDALIALYHATDGDSWTDKTNWLTDTDLWIWEGVTVSVSDGRVTRLRLTENNLSGSIPAALGNLSNLRSLFLYGNALGGPIPSELGNLSNLRGLVLYGNALSGPIPSELGNLSSLQELSLSVNVLSGPIPSELGNLSNLASLALSDNALSGPIPSELGNLSNLRGLFLGGNELAGPIPPALGDLSHLQALWLYDNALSGPIPSELGNLSNLVHLFLNDNSSLTGTLPHSLTRMTNPKTFHFHNTGLCAPLDGAFQTWLQRIGDSSGSNCASSG